MTPVVPDNGVVTQVTEVEEKPKRGRETTLDMIRSLGLVMVIVVAIWFFAQPPSSDEQELRVVDPTTDVAAFAGDQPDVPVPTGLPDRWRPTSTTYLAGESLLRVGYVTPSDTYAEYAAVAGPVEEVRDAYTGDGVLREQVEVDGQAWELYEDEDGSLSLVRTYGDITVIVGTLRSSAGLGDLDALVRSLRIG